MSVITDLGYFVSRGSYSGQTCFSLLDADISYLFPGAVTVTKLAFLFWMLTLVICFPGQLQ